MAKSPWHHFEGKINWFEPPPKKQKFKEKKKESS
jgi:hypothetical protein